MTFGVVCLKKTIPPPFIPLYIKGGARGVIPPLEISKARRGYDIPTPLNVYNRIIFYIDKIRSSVILNSQFDFMEVRLNCRMINVWWFGFFVLIGNRGGN